MQNDPFAKKCTSNFCIPMFRIFVVVYSEVSAIHFFLSNTYLKWFFTTAGQVVSDKVLVKQLQKEVARLEAELKVPDPTTEITSSEALLHAKDLQIQKVCSGTGTVCVRFL